MAMSMFPGRSNVVVKVLLYVAIVALSSAVNAHGGHDENTPYAFNPPHLGKPDYKFVFYQHDQLITPTNRSAYAVTLPVSNVDNYTLSDQSWLLNVNDSWFGTIVVFDDSLTIAPAINTTEIGKARGINVFVKNQGSENENQGVEWLWTAVFNQGSGLGNSTLCFKGWDLFQESLAGVTEIAICGGTGKFRLARGFAKISVVIIDAVSASLKYDVSVYF